jgi:hypothetical protein
MSRQRTVTKGGRFTRAELRRLRRLAARSWEDPVAAAQARDDLAWDRRRNPSKDRRFATTRMIRRPPPKPASEATTRIIRRNPRRRTSTSEAKQQEARASRWWRDRTDAERRKLMSLLSPAYARNPGKPGDADRAFRRALAAMMRADRAAGRRRKKHVRDYDRYMRRARNPAHGERAALKGSRRRYAHRHRATPGVKLRGDMINKTTKQQRRRAERRYGKKLARTNPKRDGSPTRGEKRRVKYLAYLKTLQAKGQDAAAAIARLTSEVAKTKPKDAYAPVGPRATKRVERMPAAEYFEKRIQAEDVLDTPQAPAEDRPEPTEARLIRSRLADIEALVKDAQLELQDFDLESDADAEMACEVQERIATLNKQRRTLEAKLDDVLATQTNPRRRVARGIVRVRRSTLARLDRSLRALRKSITTALRR